MPRILNATLEAALDAQNFGKPIIRGWIGTEGGLEKEVQVIRYELGGMTLRADFYRDNTEITGFGYDSLVIERGLEIAGIEYTIFSLPYNIKLFTRIRQVYTVFAEFTNESSYAASGDVTYESAITSWLLQASAQGFTPSFREASASWLDYQFLPDGKQINLNRNIQFLALIRQKFLIFLADNINTNSPLVFSVDDTFLQTTNDWEITLNDMDTFDEIVVTKKFRWVDENGTYNVSSVGDISVHNLGFLESTAQIPKAAPDSTTLGRLYYPKTKVVLPFHLKYLTGDRVRFFADSDTVLDVVEKFDPNTENPWRIELSPLDYLSNTEGGHLPSTIERVSNYTPLDSTGFDGILSPAVNNLQALAQAVDDIGIPASYQLSVTVVSDELVVALKNKDGDDPSASNPVRVQIGDTVRTITSALSVTLADAINWFNAGAAELATKQLPYFPYLAWRTASASVVIGVGRFPWASLYSDFHATNTNEKHGAFSTAPASTDSVVNIGYFEATLSADAYTWSVPTFTDDNLKHKPTFKSNYFDWVPQWTVITDGDGVSSGKAKWIGGDQLFVQPKFVFGSTSAMGSGIPTCTLPFTGRTYLVPPANTNGQFQDTGTTIDSALIYVNPTSLQFFAIYTGGAYFTRSGLSSTIPFTWANTDIISVDAVYGTKQ